MTGVRTLRIGIIGYGWMGRVHGQAYGRVAAHYPESAALPRVVAVADPMPELAATGARVWGAERAVSRWEDVVGAQDVDAVSITVPNFLHRDIAVAAARAGKHLWVEKPVGRDAAETREVAEAVRAAQVQGTAGFNYRNAPAVERARELVRGGRLGRVTHAYFFLLSDYAAHPETPLSWRYTREQSGTGVLGDLMSHGIDLARYVVGEITGVLADEAVFVPERPVPGAPGTYARVENEDYVSALARFHGGARGIFEAGRTSAGEQCTYGFRIHAERGALEWEFKRMGELRVCVADDYANTGFTTEYVGPGAGDFGRYQPGAGMPMGYDDLKVVEAERFLRSVATGVAHGPTVDDAAAAAAIVEAMGASAGSGTWTQV